MLELSLCNLNEGTGGDQIKTYDGINKTDSKFGNLACEKMGFGKNVQFIGIKTEYKAFMKSKGLTPAQGAELGKSFNIKEAREKILVSKFKFK